MLGLVRIGERPPRNGCGTDWVSVAAACGIGEADLRNAGGTIQYVFDALHRAKPKSAKRKGKPKKTQLAASSPERRTRHRAPAKPAIDVCQSGSPASVEKKRGRKPGAAARPIVEFPVAKNQDWDDPGSFQEALALHMNRFGDSCHHLWRAIVQPGDITDRRTLLSWRRGEKSPRTVESLAVLLRIERRYRLPAGYFKAKLPHPARAAKGHVVNDIGAAERRRLAWHLPDDFDSRPEDEQEQILTWVRTVIVSGATDYRQF